MLRVSRRLAPIALILLFATGVAACGGGDDESGPDQASPSSSLAVPSESASPESTDAAIPTSTIDESPAVALEESEEDEPDIAAPSVPTFSLGTGVPRPAPALRRTGEWINSEPFTLESQRGNVVLIDFWTYTCVNCIRTLPYLKEWHAKYADQGLVILGVHTPEFDFEKDIINVTSAVQDFGIEYPVVQDNDFGTWQAFSNRFWPAKYLIDSEGVIRYTHFGEGAYAETEDEIRKWLIEAGSDLGGISSATLPEPERDATSVFEDPGTSRTRELYAGLNRNFMALRSEGTPPYVLHSEYFESPNTETLYTDPGEHQNHFLYLSGLWLNQEESLVHARETEDYEDYVIIKFFGTSVNVVLAGEESSSYHVRLTFDGMPLEPDQAGADVMFDDEGNSFVLVDGDQMYNLVNLESFSGHLLQLSSNSPNFELFAFTFGDYVGGEPAS